MNDLTLQECQSLSSAGVGFSLLLLDKSKVRLTRLQIWQLCGQKEPSFP